MKFLMKNVVRVTGASRDKIEQWMQKGWVVPFRKASGQGTRNIFSYTNLILIKVFMHLTESGWYREPAGNFIESIRDEDIRILISFGIYDSLLLLKQEVIVDFISPDYLERMTDIVGGDSAKAPQVVEHMIETMSENSVEAELYLVFGRLVVNDTKVTSCFPVVENTNPNLPFSLNHRFEDLFKKIEFRILSDIYIINFSKVMEEINKKILKLYPEKFVDQYKKFLEKRRVLFDNSKNGKVRIQDVLDICIPEPTD